MYAPRWLSFVYGVFAGAWLILSVLGLLTGYRDVSVTTFLFMVIAVFAQWFDTKL